MNEEQLLRTLAAAARNDAPPAVDVTAAVMTRIQAPPKRRANILLWTYAAATAVAATFVAAWTAHLLGLQDNAASLDLIGPVIGSLP